MRKKKFGRIVRKERNKNSETFGIVGLTLGYVGIFSLIFTAPLISIIFFIIGGIFALLQQKRKPTKYGRIALILNFVGIVVSIIWWVVLIQVVIPYLVVKYPELVGGAF